MSDSRLQEIVTKAVVGRAERRMTWSHTVPAEGVTGVLGVHVSKTNVVIIQEKGDQKIDLTVDCDLWCSDSKNTKIVACTCKNTESCAVQTVGQVLGEREMRTATVGPARAVGVEIQDGKVILSLEADVMVELTALTRMWVKAYDLEDDLLDDLDGTSSDDSGSSSDDDSMEA